jgi:hypothetical protein
VRCEGLDVHTAQRTAWMASHCKLSRRIPWLSPRVRSIASRKMVGLHIEASRRRDELLAECQRLIEAGIKGRPSGCSLLLTALMREGRRGVPLKFPGRFVEFWSRRSLS